MADTNIIKLGNADLNFKVGSSDCKIYLGEVLLYPHSPSAVKFYAEYSSGQTKTVECNGSSGLTSGETKGSDYEYEIMTAATIGDCVTSIGDDAFSRCFDLTSITIPSGVTSIGFGAFQDCNSLTSVIIPSGVTSVGGYAFYSCDNLSDATILNNTIGSHAFNDCFSLSSVTIGNSVTSIGNSAFKYCSGLTSVTIPSGVTSIDYSAFQGCSGLTSVTIEATTPPTLGYPLPFQNTNDCPIYVPAASVNAYKSASDWSTYASRIQAIPSPTFAWKAYDDNGGLLTSGDCSVLTDNVLTQEAVTNDWEIETDVAELVIGDCVTSLVEDGFDGWSSLTAVTIGTGITEIGESAFYGCGLTSITIPNNVTSIGNTAFDACSSLTSITLSNSLTTLGYRAFADTSIESVTIPDSVTTMGDSENGSEVFAGCTSLSSITIPSGITEIGNGTFENCQGLTNITLPDNITSIGSSAFAYCTSLSSITIPSGVTSIGYNAFGGCTSFTSIIIPSGVTSIDADAFNGCESLTSITVEATTPPTLEPSAFDWTNDCPIYVPAASVEDYKAATNWSDYASRIQAIP